jgi:hypothetical protein
MARPSSLSPFAALLLAALAACDPPKPAKEPEGSADPAAGGDKDIDKGGEKGEKGEKAEGPSEPAAGDKGETPPKAEIDKGLSLDTYEMTPSDCNALGRHYGEVARNDQVAGLSPKLTEKQRSSTVAQIDKVVGKLEESWTNGCHNSLVNKAVDNASIKCALAAKTVKDFDICINGREGATVQPRGKGPGKKQ